VDTSTHKLVQIILQKNDLLLVQWKDQEDSPSRAWVTPDMVVSVEGKQAVVDSPSAGIPYGVEWAGLVEFHASPFAFQKFLRGQGIWTVADLRANPDGVRVALQATYGIDVTAFNRAVNERNSTEV